MAATGDKGAPRDGPTATATATREVAVPANGPGDMSQSQRDKRVEELWHRLVPSGARELDLKGLKKGLRRIDHPMKNADDMLRQIIKIVDSNGDGKIQYEEFRVFVETAERQLWMLFRSIDRDHDGRLNKDELKVAVQKCNLTIPARRLSGFFDDMDMNHDGFISFDEWRDFLLFIPMKGSDSTLETAFSYYASIVILNAEGDSMVSDDTLEGLGTTGFLLQALFGSIVKLAQPSLDPPASTPDTATAAAAAAAAAVREKLDSEAEADQPELETPPEAKPKHKSKPKPKPPLPASKPPPTPPPPPLPPDAAEREGQAAAAGHNGAGGDGGVVVVAAGGSGNGGGRGDRVEMTNEELGDMENGLRRPRVAAEGSREDYGEDDYDDDEYDILDETDENEGLETDKTGARLPKTSTTQKKHWFKRLTHYLPHPGYFLAGAIAGGISRTATAPFDRLKVYLLVNTRPGSHASIDAAKHGHPVGAIRSAGKPIGDAIKSLYKAGGLRTFFAGNGLNVIKIMPETAIKFGSYEAAKRTFAALEGHGDPMQISPYSKFVAGGLAGMTAQLCVYPLDTLKFRLQCETVPGGPTGNKLLIQTAKKMYQTGGFRAAYRGITMGLIGMFPYSAIDMGTFELLKGAFTRYKARYYGIHEEDAAPGNVVTGFIGATSGAFGATVVYPLNVLRTRLQTQGTAMHPATYTGIWDVGHRTIANEGARGLYKGLTPNLLKVAPALSITWVVYENSKKFLGLP